MPLPSFFFRSSSSLDINADTLTDPSTSPSCTYLTTSSSRTTSSSHSAVDPTRRPSRYRIDSLCSAHSIDKSPSSSILSIDIESPPLVFYGGASTSTGALLTGKLKVDVREEEMEVEGFSMRLVVDATMKKPFQANCAECATQSSDLTSWSFLQGTTVLGKGEHSFPFSFLLPGQYQVCTHSSLASVAYTLRALLTPTSFASTPSPPLQLCHSLTVIRAIRPPDAPRRYIQDFPPTAISAHVSLPVLIHPTCAFLATLSLRGLKRDWVLRRVNWRLDETQTVIAPACLKHAPRSGSVKGIVRSAFCTLGAGELISGWTTTSLPSLQGDVGPAANLDFIFGPVHPSVALCDVKTEDGTETAHALVMEVLVESAAGTRLLKMRFHPAVTEREKGGLAWDEEAPPVYGEGGGAPPVYIGDAPGYEEIVGEAVEGVY